MATLQENISIICQLLRDIRTAISEKTEITGATALDYPQKIRDISIENYPEFRQWLILGGFAPNKYGSLEEVLASEDFDVLINNEQSASYAAYIANTIANAIKLNGLYTRKVLTCAFSYMFFNSSKNFDENIEDITTKNPLVTSENQKVEGTDRNVVQYSAQRADSGYYAYMAFNGEKDSSNQEIIFEYRNIWSAYENNQWVQYEYAEPKRLAYVKVYSLRDNAPTGIKIEGSNDGENFVELTTQVFNTTISSIGADYFEKINCSQDNKYKYFRFTILGSYYGDFSCVGEIIIYTYKE